MKKLLLVLAFLILIPAAWPQASLAPVGVQQFFDNTGTPLAGGLIYTYAAGTTTPLATYTDATGTVQASNPIVLDAGGSASIWLGSASYKFVVQKADGTTVSTTDNITSGSDTVILGVSNTWSAAQLFKAGPIFDIKAYGADPSGINDSSAAINNAFTAALAAGGNSRVACTNGTFLIQAKVVIKTNADFSNCAFSVNVNSVTVPWAVEISTGNATNPTTILSAVEVHLPSITNANKPGTGWASQGGGVRSVNLQHSSVYFTGNVYGFTTGFAEVSYGGNGNVYNNIYGYYSNTNMIGLYQCPGDTSSWVNENKHFGGAFRINSAEGNGITGAYFVQMCKVGASGHNPNNHLFTGQSFEGNGPQYYIRTSGSFNLFLNDRWEGTTPTIYFEADSSTDGSDNTVFGGYGDQNIVFTYDAGYVGAGGTEKNNLLTTRGSNTTVGGSYGNQIRNTTSSGNPAFTLYEATIDAWSTPTNWSLQLGSQFLYGKRNADANPRVELDFVNGRVNLGNATGTPTCYFGGFGIVGLTASCNFMPVTDAAEDAGIAAQRWRDVYFSGSLKNGTLTWAPPASGGTLALTSQIPSVLVASLTTTAATTDVVSITGMTSVGHCTISATNASAATNVATTYISAKATNQVTVTHTATASMTYDLICSAI